MRKIVFGMVWGQLFCGLAGWIIAYNEMSASTTIAVNVALVVTAVVYLTVNAVLADFRSE